VCVCVCMHAREIIFFVIPFWSFQDLETSEIEELHCCEDTVYGM